MEGRIDDENKAWEMAHSAKGWRDAAATSNKEFTEDEKYGFDRRADRMEREAGENYDREQLAHKKKKNLEAGINEGENFPETFNPQELIESISRLVAGLRARENDELSPLIEPDEISRLRLGSRGLEEATESKDFAALESSLTTINKALDGIGRAQSSHEVRESDESFGRIIFLLKNMQDVCSSIGSKVKDNQPLTAKLERIYNTAEAKWQFVAKRRDLLRSYLDRRY